MKKFLLTGITGQDGTILKNILQKKGYIVAGITHNKSNVTDQIYFWDWKSVKNLEDILISFNPDFFINLAAYHHSSFDLHIDPYYQEKMFNVNLNGLRIIVETILKTNKDCALINAASSQIYRPQKDVDLVNENTLHNPSTIYGVYKSAGIKLTDYFREYYELKVSNLIFFNHESELRPDKFVSRLITKKSAEIKLGISKNLYLKNIGARADFSSAFDFMEALDEVCENNIFEDFILASGYGTSILDIVENCFNVLNLDIKKHLTYELNETLPYLIGDTAKIQKILSWKPKRSINQVILKMLEFDMHNLKKSKI